MAHRLERKPHALHNAGISSELYYGGGPGAVRSVWYADGYDQGDADGKGGGHGYGFLEILVWKTSPLGNVKDDRPGRYPWN